DKRLFPHKYMKKRLQGSQEITYGIYSVLGAIVLFLLASALLGMLGFASNTVMIYALLIVLIASLVLIIFGEIKLFGKTADA
ncbi:MAG: hypothetical protein AAFO82_21810, partial [Bacteroidota bacterium]